MDAYSKPEVPSDAAAEFTTKIAETKDGLYRASFSYRGVAFLVGVFESQEEAHIQVLVAFQRRVRDLSSDLV